VREIAAERLIFDRSDQQNSNQPTCPSQGRKQARSCHQQPLTGNLQRCVRATHERYEHHQTHGWASVLCIRVRSISTLIIEVDHSVRLLRTISAKVAARKGCWCGGAKNRRDMCPRVQIGCCTWRCAFVSKSDQTPSTGGLCRGRGYGPGCAWIRLTYVLRSLSKTLCDLHLLRRVRQAQSPVPYGTTASSALHTEL
jgi:hypothetical protein